MTTNNPNGGFYIACWNLPGCLPDTTEPLPVFGSYDDAAQYLADQFAFASASLEPCAEDLDRFDDLRIELRATIGDTDRDGWDGDGPDGYRYVIESCEPKATFVAEPVDQSETESRGRVLLTCDADEDIRDEFQCIAGSAIEAPADMPTVYAVVSLHRLEEARDELRESGYALDLSFWPTLRECLTAADLSCLDTFRISDYYSGLDLDHDADRRGALLALACDAGGSSISYGGLDASRTIDDADVVTHSAIGGSDYTNGSVGRSNAAMFRELLDGADSRLRLDVSGGHGTDGVFAFLDVRTTSAAAGAIAETLRFLLDYPLISDDDLSRREQEEADETWTSYAGDDYARALQKRYDLDDVTDSEGALRELFDVRADHANVAGGPGVEHTCEGAHFYVDEVAEQTPAALVAFLDLLDLDELDLLDLAIAGDGDDARRLSRILSVGRTLRRFVQPAIARGLVAETERRFGPEPEQCEDPNGMPRVAHAQFDARRMILRADIEEGETSDGICAMTWGNETLRSVSVTLRRYVHGSSFAASSRMVTVVIDPRKRYLHGTGIEAALAPLFDSETENNR